MTLKTPDPASKDVMKDVWHKIGFVVGLVALPLLVFLAVMVFVFPEPPLVPEQVTILRGTIDRVILPGEIDGNDDLQISLAGEPVVLKLLSAYRYASVASSPGLVAPGASAEIGVPAVEIGKPLHNYITDTDFRQICSLTVNGAALLDIAAYNQQNESDSLIGKIAVPLIVAVDVFLIAATAAYLFGKKRKARKAATGS